VEILPQGVAADTANLADQTVGQIQALQPERLQFTPHMWVGMLKAILRQGFSIFKPEFQLDHSRRPESWLLTSLQSAVLQRAKCSVCGRVEYSGLPGGKCPQSVWQSWK
jgi:hypothetical protein